MRFVKTATSKSIPSTRCSASAWEETSIATPPTDRSRMRASSAWSSTASGVVCRAGKVSGPTRYWIVPITPAGAPTAASSASQR